MALARLAAAVRAVNGAFPDLANGHSHAVRADRAGQSHTSGLRLALDRVRRSPAPKINPGSVTVPHRASTLHEI
jgi:hypothetical protein